MLQPLWTSQKTNCYTSYPTRISCKYSLVPDVCSIIPVCYSKLRPRLFLYFHSMASIAEHASDLFAPYSNEIYLTHNLPHLPFVLARSCTWCLYHIPYMYHCSNAYASDLHYKYGKCLCNWSINMQVFVSPCIIIRNEDYFVHLPCW